MEIILRYSGTFEEFLSELALYVNIRVTDLGQGFAAAEVSDDMPAFLRSLPFIEDIELSKDIFLNETEDFIPCPSDPELRPKLYSGRGVIVGIIDTGIDYRDPRFRTADGRTRIISIWDQSIDGSPPAGFYKGSEYSAFRINEALSSPDPKRIVPHTDFSGHVTAVAGIAAGNTFGAAYNSDIIVVKVRQAENEYSKTTQIMKALRYIIDKARSLRRPLAVNISYGMNEGSHRGDSLFESYISAVSSEWKLSVIIPTGNEGAAGHHYEGRLNTGETLDIGFFTSAGIRSLYLSIWKNYIDEISCELFLPGGESTGVINRFSSPAFSAAGGLAISSVYGQPTRRSAAQEIFYDIRPAGRDIPAGAWELRMKAGSIGSGHIDIWLPTLEQVGAGTYFADPSDRLTMTIPSTCRKVIRTAGFDRITGAAAAFSGRGAGCPDDIMPDIAAPAVNISAPTPGGGIGSFTGTSFAAPFITGYAALLMEWGIVCGNSPFMYGEKLKARLRLAATRDPSIRYPDPSTGYGKIFGI